MGQGAFYNTRAASCGAVMLVILAAHAVSAHNGAITDVFTDEEVQACGRFRTPNLVQTPDGAVHVVARCCGMNMCSGKDAAGTIPAAVAARHNLAPATRWHNGPVNVPEDNNKDCKVVMKTTTDGGSTWGNYQVVSAPSGLPGFANGAAIYDRLRKRIVLQYQYFPLGSTAPAVNTTYYQRFSSDNGETWTPPVDITPMLAGCNPDINNMQCQSAGNKIQSASGRLLWPGHDHGGNVCVWYSDDGGLSYNASNIVAGSEVSVAELVVGTPSLYMNGRGTSEFEPHRASYFSTNNGAKWSEPVQSALIDDGGHPCERALINVDNVLYSSEPVGHGRTSMQVTCSKDGAKTWPSSISVNGDKQGGYSDLSPLSSGKLLMVWEDKDIGNFLSSQVDTTWCT